MPRRHRYSTTGTLPLSRKHHTGQPCFLQPLNPEVPGRQKEGAPLHYVCNYYAHPKLAQDTQNAPRYHPTNPLATPNIIRNKTQQLGRCIRHCQYIAQFFSATNNWAQNMPTCLCQTHVTSRHRPVALARVSEYSTLWQYGADQQSGGQA
jgi:hypothetical protein